MIYEIYSFDFDGALAHYEYLKSKDKDIIKANIALLESIKASVNSHSSSSSSPSKKTKLIVFVGSNRQAFRDDFGNSTPDERGSCYPAIKRVSKYLGAELDEMLLGDIYNDLPDGTCFRKALKYIKNSKDYIMAKLPEDIFFPDWLHDDSKLTLLYAQMHKMSLKYPNDILNYNFVDDREDIVTNLYEYFIQYPEMIPHNVTLNLKKYIGPTDKYRHKVDPLVTEFAPIRGTRPSADQHYRQTIKTMAAVTIEEMAAHNYDLSTPKSSYAVKTYAEALSCQFDMTSIKCVQYYTPGMLPIHPPEIPTYQKGFRLFGRTFLSSSSLISSNDQPSSSSPRPSSIYSSSSSGSIARHQPSSSQSTSSLPSPIPTPSSSSNSKFQSDPGPYFYPATSSVDSFHESTQNTFDSDCDEFELPLELDESIIETPKIDPDAERNNQSKATTRFATSFEFTRSIGRHRSQVLPVTLEQEAKPIAARSTDGVIDIDDLNLPVELSERSIVESSNTKNELEEAVPTTSSKSTTQFFPLPQSLQQTIGRHRATLLATVSTEREDADEEDKDETEFDDSVPNQGPTTNFG